MTSIPTWVAVLVGLGTPLLTFGGVLLVQSITRSSANQLEARSRREETLRVLRWAAELAVADDQGRARLGVEQLRALGDSDLLDGSQQLFVDAALRAVVESRADEVDEVDDETTQPE